MLTEWIHWLSSPNRAELLLLVIVILVTDAPRYAVSNAALCAYDWVGGMLRWFLGRNRGPRFQHSPTVTAIIAGHNEADTIQSTLGSLWGSYPRLEIIVVDDGSRDGMAAKARVFAKDHEGILVLSRPERGGKSSAMNFALRYSHGEIIVVIDADSELGDNAVWEIVQPMADPKVGAVAGSVVVRNPFASLATWFQAYEYTSSLLVGRMTAAHLGILGIISGAFGAFRHSTLQQVMGWDVGPPEDLDLTLAFRKAGYTIACAPYAICSTEAPESFRGLFRQRRRWERSGIIRNHCRKHLDMAFPWQANFRFSNFVLWLESWFFNVFCLYGMVAWLIWVAVAGPPDRHFLFMTLYVVYFTLELIQAVTNLFYTPTFWKDLCLGSIFFLVPFYRFAFIFVRLFATSEEVFFRTSFLDNFVPEKVRNATWKW